MEVASQYIRREPGPGVTQVVCRVRGCEGEGGQCSRPRAETETCPHYPLCAAPFACRGKNPVPVVCTRGAPLRTSFGIVHNSPGIAGYPMCVTQYCVLQPLRPSDEGGVEKFVKLRSEYGWEGYIGRYIRRLKEKVTP